MELFLSKTKSTNFSTPMGNFLEKVGNTEKKKCTNFSGLSTSSFSGSWEGLCSSNRHERFRRKWFWKRAPKKITITNSKNQMVGISRKNQRIFINSFRILFREVFIQKYWRSGFVQVWKCSNERIARGPYQWIRSTKRRVRNFSGANFVMKSYIFT